MRESFDTQLRSIVDRDPRYARNAYLFIFEALEYTCRTMQRKGHVTGHELALGIRDLAILQFGGLARMVFDQWGIRSTTDFGEIVFNLVGANLMGRQENDSREDFHDVYSFDDAFPIVATPKK